MNPEDRRLAHNVAAYNAVARTYDQQHPEIFNPVEQSRLGAAVRRVLAAVTPGVAPAGRAATAYVPHVIDIGTGSGNLTAHFLDAGARVTAADVSAECLRLVSEKFGASGRLDTRLLDGRGLGTFADASVDVAACYSVLHHVSDYLALVREMARVVRPGGVVYIDHERHDDSWDSAEREQFVAEAVVWPPKRWTRFVKPQNYWRRIRPLLQWQRWRNPRWMPEGDLHIWPDDHIEYRRVRATLAEAGVTDIELDDYLLYEARYQRDVWERWRHRVTDYRMLMGRKA